jgi:CO/xanthine dehydrogenase FAD-binding subunit
MRDFEYFEPASVKEAVSLLAKYRTEAKVWAGGTDLAVNLKHDVIRPKYIVNIGAIPKLAYIDFDHGKELRIGALTTMRALIESAELRKACPVIPQAVSQLGNPTIRNVATLGGNLCNASPAADSAPVLIGLSAKVKVAGPDGGRVIPLEDFFSGPHSNVLKAGEIVTEIQVPIPPANTRGIYLKYGGRGVADLAIVGVAIIANIEAKSKVCNDIKIVLGSVAPTPMRAKKAEESIKGQAITPALIDKIAQIAASEARPITDVRASAGYRKTLVNVYVKRALRELMA